MDFSGAATLLREARDEDGQPEADAARMVGWLPEYSKSSLGKEDKSVADSHLWSPTLRRNAKDGAPSLPAGRLRVEGMWS